MLSGRIITGLTFKECDPSLLYYPNRALGKVKEAEAIEATMKMKAISDVSQSQPVFSTDLNLFNQGQGLNLSKWESKTKM